MCATSSAEISDTGGVDIACSVAEQIPGARAAVVFGSYARGSAVQGLSDLDVLVFVDDRVCTGSTREIVKELCGETELSVLVHDRRSLASLCASDWSFADHLARENIPAFGAVEELNERLRQPTPPTATIREHIAAHREVTARLKDPAALGGEHLVAYGRLYGAFKSAAILDGIASDERCFDRNEASAALARRNPELATACEQLSALEPFWLRLRRRVKVEIPWSPRRDEARLHHHVGVADEVLCALAQAR